MAFRSSASTFQAAGGSGALTATPAGVVAGDYLGALYCQDAFGHAPLALSAGWTQQAIADLSAPDGQFIRYCDKVAAGGDAFVFGTGDSQGATLQVVALSGRKTTSPTSFITPTTNLSSNASPVAASYAGGTAAAGDDLLVFIGLDITASPAGWGFGAIAGFTDRTSVQGGDTIADLFTKDNLSAGATGSIAQTLTLTSGSGNIGYGAVVIAVQSSAGPTINTQPSDANAQVGDLVTISVTATTSGGTLTYQWQDDSTGAFANISGATSASLVIGPAAAGQNGRHYRCVVSDSNGSTISNAALLLVTYPWRYSPPTYEPLRDDAPIGFLALLDTNSWFVPVSAGLAVEKWFVEELNPPVTGGGNVYNVSASDSITASDASTNTGVLSATATDAASATDASTTQAVRAAAATDAVSAADAATTQAAVSAAAADSASASDAATAQTTVAAAASDSASASDAASVTAALSVAATDAASATDSASATGSFAATASDAAAATDSASTQATRAAAATDSVTATDSASIAAVLTVTASDAASTADSAAATGAFSASATDAVAATDAATTNATVAASASDAVTAGDSAAVQVTLSAAASDAVTATDVASSASAVSSSASDAITVTDSSAAVLTRVASASDAVSASDVASIVATLSVAATDAVSATDASTTQEVVGAAATDSVTAIDSATTTSAAFVSASDAVSAADSATAALTLTVAATDAVAALDSASATGVFSASATDAASVGDSATAALVITVAAADSVSTSDAATVALVATATATDAVTVADAATTQLNIFVSVTESIAATDSASSQATVGADAADDVTLIDAATGPLAITRSATDSVSLADTASALFVFLEGVADAVAADDQATALLTLAESVSDTVVLTDVATGISVGAGVDPYNLWNYPIEGAYTAADLFRLMAAVLAGKSTIMDLGAGAATVTFKAIDDSDMRVTAQMAGSVRTNVTLDTLATPAPSGGTTSDPANIWNYVLEGTYSVGQTLRIMAAVLAGKDSIVDLGNQQAHIEFRAVDDSATRVAVDFTQSERIHVDLTP